MIAFQGFPTTGDPEGSDKNMKTEPGFANQQFETLQSATLNRGQSSPRYHKSMAQAPLPLDHFE